MKKAYETQGGAGWMCSASRARGGEEPFCPTMANCAKRSDGLTVVSIVGVNGTGKTTTAAKLAHYMQGAGRNALLAACDTFRAAAIEQIKLWGQRLKVDVIAGAYGADPAAVAHDAVTAAQARKAEYLVRGYRGAACTRSTI